MGFDFEGILGASSTRVGEAYEDAVSEEMYRELHNIDFEPIHVLPQYEPADLQPLPDLQLIQITSVDDEPAVG